MSWSLMIAVAGLAAALLRRSSSAARAIAFAPVGARGILSLPAWLKWKAAISTRHRAVSVNEYVLPKMRFAANLVSAFPQIQFLSEIPNSQFDLQLGFDAWIWLSFLILMAQRRDPPHGGHGRKARRAMSESEIAEAQKALF